MLGHRAYVEPSLFWLVQKRFQIATKTVRIHMFPLRATRMT